MSLLDDIQAAADQYVSDVQAGLVVEPDGVPAVIVPIPAGDLGYGRDLSCTSDLTPNMDEVDENSPEAVSEALYRRITTQHGALSYLGEDPDYGRDVIAFLSADMDKIEIMAQQDLLAAECLKDDRVKSCQCTITYLGTDESGSAAFDISIDGELHTGRTYSLTETLTSGAKLVEDMAS